MSDLGQSAKEARYAGKYPLALSLYRQLLQTTPKQPSALEGMAYCLYELGRKQEATAASRAALEADPSLVLPHVVLAYLCDADGETARSREEARIALALNPNSAEALCCEGVLMGSDGQLKESIEYLEKAVQINPKMYLAHYNLAVSYRKTGDFRAANRQLETIFRLKPNPRNLVRLFGSILETNRVVFAALVLIPLLALSTSLRFLLILHAILILLYLSSALFAAREKQGKIARRNLLMAALFAFIDAVILTKAP